MYLTIIAPTTNITFRNLESTIKSDEGCYKKNPTSKTYGIKVLLHQVKFVATKCKITWGILKNINANLDI